MSPFIVFIEELLCDGEVNLCQPLEPARRAYSEAAKILEQAYATWCLSVAGPPIPFDGKVATAAAALVYYSCWFLVDHSLSSAEMEKILTMPGLPESPAHHLSADLLFHFLPQIHSRIQSVDATEPLAEHLAKVLRQWPLSGVLADVTEGPLTPLDFGGHAGLMWLYAERWCRKEMPAWLPEGRGLEHVEVIWTDLGKDAQLLHQLAKAETTESRA